MISLNKKCTDIRVEVLRMLNESKSGHSGGSLSAVELIAGAYYQALTITVENCTDANRDRFVLSKGHAAPVLYSILADKGFFPKEELYTLRKLHSRLQGHPDSKKLPGIEAATGSLGQGCSIAVGMAMAAKSQKKSLKVFTLLGDGELQEGVVWEACMAASAYKLDNLTLIVDVNGLQLDGPCDQILPMGNLADKFSSFGFNVIEVEDGNNIKQVLAAYAQPPVMGIPTCILAHTIKGKGVSFIENQVGWHGKVPNDKELELAIIELQEN
ncbi:transketolase [Oceanispirochaeta crateris]|uniref:Transketolase n=1 Tax=Oceanispirochaeta crateris TaxID=2518645 RepID=A0A5C1QKN5_9SPIO|nr:transketolase [Oceanispirochaeta crateris]QEN08161.1 transketolase [Oceanispirochaeta crateris]